jgi:hydrogenase maturation protease
MITANTREAKSQLSKTPELQESPAGLLVVGYGNSLRRDDGVGPKVAEAVAALGLPGVQALACALLTPELAEPVSRAGAVIFVDAAVDAPRKVQMRTLAPAATSQLIAHAANPATLLALARDVFSHAPEAWWLTIPVEDLGIGEELSPLAQRGFDLAVEQVKKWAADKHCG